MTTLRKWGALTAVCCGVLAGCTDVGGRDADVRTSARAGDARGEAGPAPEASASASPGASAPSTDPARHPRTSGQGRALIGRLLPDPKLFGPEVRRAVPYQSDPRRWAELDENCVWQLRKPPKDVLATRTRYFWLPEDDGRGAVRLTATVTVHRTALGAGWEQAGMLEEALGCQEQVLRPGERLAKLASFAFARGEGGNVDVDDSLIENGVCLSETRGGPYPYFWQQVVLGPVVMAVSGCGGEGRTEEEVQALTQETLSRVMLRAQQELGRDGEPGAKGGS